MTRIERYSSAVVGRLRWQAHWRCKEPVIVFESDDWGLKRKSCSDLVAQFGRPSEWADEETETPEDLQKLYDVLDSHRDESGRAPCLTANFVVSNPDFDSIVERRFNEYLDVPITEETALLPKWREGLERRVFFPQFHARHHFAVNRWLGDLQENVPGARELCARHCHGGLALIKGQGWKYHSEYLDWTAGQKFSTQELQSRLDESMAIFKKSFGMTSLSTIAPHYLFTPETNAAWRKAGVQFVQGCGYRILRNGNNSKRVIGHAMGERSPEGLVYLTRPIKFEPRPERPQQGLASALEAIKSSFRARVPAVIDTHRINFSGRWREQTLRALNELLSTVREFRPRFLTTVELGQAIQQDGAYNDSWSGEVRSLTPADSFWRRELRGALSRFHSGLVQKTAN